MHAAMSIRVTGGKISAMDLVDAITTMAISMKANGFVVSDMERERHSCRQGSDMLACGRLIDVTDRVPFGVAIAPGTSGCSSTIRSMVQDSSISLMALSVLKSGRMGTKGATNELLKAQATSRTLRMLNNNS